MVMLDKENQKLNICYQLCRMFACNMPFSHLFHHKDSKDEPNRDSTSNSSESHSHRTDSGSGHSVRSSIEHEEMTEYWLISAPGDKTCQQTWETMNDLTSKQNNLSTNFKFQIPDLKVGTLDQLVGLSDDLGKLDGFVEQVTRKVAQYLGEVLEDQRDKLHENLMANNNDIESVDNKKREHRRRRAKSRAVPNGRHHRGHYLEEGSTSCPASPVERTQETNASAVSMSAPLMHGLCLFGCACDGCMVMDVDPGGGGGHALDLETTTGGSEEDDGSPTRTDLVLGPADLPTYLTRFQWDIAKYPIKQSLRNIADIISKQVGQIDADLKTKSSAYNNLKGSLQSLEKKQTGSLLTRNLADLVKKDHFILDSEYLQTLLVIVPRSQFNEWNATYEKITDMIVPRSSQLITQDNEYGLFTVTCSKRSWRSSSYMPEKRSSS
ncbi:unnamed protein product [Acanthoscelides obtectus]|uniref:V-type proton ATPase subunit C n=2 Tax=Acanthoscelides obtectus TaxID=200917 RepID=A0A9P0M4V3_ACAOB|nr:unnamed protein product [Acanthoscelides obtectus]CAK1642160.1 hypothetical protein AOBTE_LOCUS12857 [Acanthoscelides obtectus]